MDKVHAHVTDAIEQGATLLIGGQTVGRKGTYYSPTVIVGVSPAMKLFYEETFGPVAGVTRFRTEGEAIELAKRTRRSAA